MDFIFISLFIWQVVLGCYVLLIWASKNLKFRKSPNLNIGEVIKTSTIEETKVKKILKKVKNKLRNTQEEMTDIRCR